MFGMIALREHRLQRNAPKKSTNLIVANEESRALVEENKGVTIPGVNEWLEKGERVGPCLESNEALYSVLRYSSGYSSDAIHLGSSDFAPRPTPKVPEAAVRKQGSSVWPHERTCQGRVAKFHRPIGPPAHPQKAFKVWASFFNGVVEIGGAPFCVGSECAEFLQDSPMQIMRRQIAPTTEMRSLVH